MILSSVGTRVNDALGQLGLPGGFLGAQIDTLLGNPIGALNNLRDGFREAALGRGTNRLERVFGGRFPGVIHAHPSCAFKTYRPICGAGYFGGRQRIDLAAGTPNNFFSRIFNPRRRGAANFERLLKTNPFARAAFEHSVGGRITSFGRSDGKMTIQRYPRGLHPLPHIGVSAFSAPAFGILPSMSQAVLGQAASMGLGALSGGLLSGNPFGAMVGAGLGSILGNPLGVGGALGGAGFGSWNPLAQSGSIGNSSTLAEGVHTAQNQSILNDPSLSVEDAIMLMMMSIMKKFDRDIKKQMDKISRMNKQQNKKTGKKGGGSGKKGGNKAQKNQNSIDIETKKLERLTTKRGNMFQSLSKIMQAYQSTAKNTIQSMNR